MTRFFPGKQVGGWLLSSRGAVLGSWGGTPRPKLRRWRLWGHDGAAACPAGGWWKVEKGSSDHTLHPPPLLLTSLLQTQHLFSRPHPSPAELTLCAHPRWPSQWRVRHHHQFSSAGVCRCAVCGILNSLNSLCPGASHLFFPKCKTTTKNQKPHKLPSSNDSVLPPLPQTSVCPLPSRAPTAGRSHPPLSPG